MTNRQNSRNHADVRFAPTAWHTFKSQTLPRAFHLIDDILTSRLKLRLLTSQVLQACLNDQFSLASSFAGFQLPAEWLQEQALIERRLGDIHKDPAYQPWSLRAMVLQTAESHQTTGEMVGFIGFHTRPNPDYLQPFVREGVELGYTVFPAHRRRGYAEEALRGMMNWATENHRVRNFILSISPNNVPSLGLSAKLGFQKIGQQIDEEDGPEDIFLLEAR